MKVCSFDVFDTVLTRIVVKPSHVFDLMERRIRRTEMIPYPVRRCFSSARVWAEFKARRTTNRGDVTLAIIYDQLKAFYALEHDCVSYLMELEMQIEKQVSSPIGNTVTALQALRKDGSRVVFVSDMYLPTEFVRELLVSSGIALPGDPVYVSGDLGVTKGSGKLFDLVLQREGIVAADLIHYGDNIHTDIYVPRERGIKVVPMPGGSSCPHWQTIASYGVRVLKARWKMGLLRVA